jgi:glutamate carboxypeptidase
MSENMFVERAQEIRERFDTDLAALVNIDSGTFLKDGVDRVGLYLQHLFQEFNFTTSFEIQEQYGNNLIAVHTGKNPQGPRLLLLGHMDTVFPADEAVRRPHTLSERDGIVTMKGPGVLDMKSGVLMGMYALHLLIEAQAANYHSVTFVCNSDEELGSPVSRVLIERLARDVDAVLVLEPGRVLNRIVSARRGIAHYRLEVHGLSSHAGVEPEKGRNAILELAHQVIALQAINGTIPGATLNVGVIRGGERTNIVPDYAYCDIDVRVSDQAGLAAIEAALRQLVTRTVLDGTRIVLSGGIRSQPFERNDANARLVQLVKDAGLTLGLSIEDVSNGGASDGNNTAGLGIPTVDGLGATGGLAHNPDEYIEVEHIPVRIALICEAVLRICDYYQSGQRL